MQERRSFKDSSTFTGALQDYNKKSVTRTNLSLFESVREGIVMNGNTILNDYIDELDSCTVEYTMTTDEESRYYMRPDLFAYDKWGDKEYAFLVLFINGIVSPKEFTNTTIKTLERDYIGSIMGLIIRY